MSEHDLPFTTCSIERQKSGHNLTTKKLTKPRSHLRQTFPSLCQFFLFCVASLIGSSHQQSYLTELNLQPWNLLFMTVDTLWFSPPFQTSNPYLWYFLVLGTKGYCRMQVNSINSATSETCRDNSYTTWTSTAGYTAQSVTTAVKLTQ